VDWPVELDLAEVWLPLLFAELLRAEDDEVVVELVSLTKTRKNASSSGSM